MASSTTTPPATPPAATPPALSDEQVLAQLEAHQQKELLRLVVVGSVDDGKSTLIGRLLHDTNGVYDDQLSAVKRASSQAGMEIDFSLFTDGLKAEREQGITIDVAYRYCTTEKRKFIIADTPGHIQYTRNMATGASTANVGLILIDARLGVLQQSRRHAYIASLLGIPHLAVAVNKMDLVDFSRDVFERISTEFRQFASQLGFKDVTFVPVSALEGDNIVEKSERAPWYTGPTILGYLETVPIAGDRNLEDFRFPVQYVIRPHLNYRGFAAEIASGRINKGDPILVLPSRQRSRVASINTYEGSLESASAPLSVTLTLTDEVDVSRGDMLVRPDSIPSVDRRFEATLVWMHQKALDREKPLDDALGVIQSIDTDPDQTIRPHGMAFPDMLAAIGNRPLVMEPPRRPFDRDRIVLHRGQFASIGDDGGVAIDAGLQNPIDAVHEMIAMHSRVKAYDAAAE